MSNYVEENLEGVHCWVNQEHGNIVQTKEGFVLMLPKIVTVGPFTTLEKAKEVLESQETKKTLSSYVDQASYEIVKNS